MLYDLLQNRLFYSSDEGGCVKWFKVIEQNLSPWVKNFYQPCVIEHIKPEQNLSGLRVRSNDFPEFQPWHMYGKVYEGEQREGFFKYRPYRYATFDYSFAGIPVRDFDPAYPRIYKNKTAVFMDLMHPEPKSLIVTSEMFLNSDDIFLHERARFCQKERAAANVLWAFHYVDCPQMAQTAQISTINYAFYLNGREVAKKGLFCHNIGAYNTDVHDSGEQKDFLSVSCDADWKLLLYHAAENMIEDKPYQRQFSDDNLPREKNTLFIGNGLIKHLYEVSKHSAHLVCSHRNQRACGQSHGQILPQIPPQSAHRICSHAKAVCDKIPFKNAKSVPSLMLENWAKREGIIKE